MSSSFGAAADLYLPTNALAACANLAPHCAGLHAHAAQRLVGLFVALARRHGRVTQRAAAAAAACSGAAGSAGSSAAGAVSTSGASGGDASTSGSVRVDASIVGAGTGAASDSGSAAEAAALVDLMRIVLEIINAIFANALARNPEVAYACLQRQDAFVPLRHHPALKELMGNLFTVNVDAYARRTCASCLIGMQ